jgi:hypothetical protein
VGDAEHDDAYGGGRLAGHPYAACLRK